MRIALAIPTITARPGLAEQTADHWRELTPGHQLDIVISTVGASWGDGLNEVYRQVRADPPDLLLCGSDDMVPHSDAWLPAILPWLEQGSFPVPRVSDPRFENYGGPRHPAEPVEDGTPTYMSTFPILKRDWLDAVFPLPEGLHYYSDNLIATLIHRAGIPAVAVPSCRILHLHAPEGRGAGYGSENNRLHIDTVRYSRALTARGIDRNTLPDSLRGHMHEERFHVQGLAMGA